MKNYRIHITSGRGKAAFYMGGMTKAQAKEQLLYAHVRRPDAFFEIKPES